MSRPRKKKQKARFRPMPDEYYGDYLSNAKLWLEYMLDHWRELT